MMKNKYIAIIISFIFIITLVINIYPKEIFAANQKIDSQIKNINNKKYPGVKKMIQAIQKQHPKWKFKVLYTGLNWNTVIKEEAKHGRNLIGANLKNYSGDWICKTCGNKRYSGGSWLCASRSAIGYMMDPRNSIYYEDIFQFLELSYDSSTTYDKNIIKAILKNTFMDDGNLDKYITTILDVCKKKDVNPYFIAVKMIQEQGTRGGATFKMKTTENGKTKYYYNIFNINATGNSVSTIVKNALSWAKNKGWDTIEKCIIGGVEFIANGYIVVGQDTLYFEKFDVIANSYYTHQYAQDVLYAQNQGERLRKILEKINATEYAYTFVIPLYENMPSKACERPSKVATNKQEEETPEEEDEEEQEKEKIDLGDPNNDGKVNSGDLFVIKQYLLKVKNIKEEKVLTAMDLNKDKKINSGDLLLMKKHLLGTYKIKQ